MRSLAAQAAGRVTDQDFDWGHVHWLVEPDSQSAGRVCVGQITFLPRQGEPEHSHFGEEQVLYVISGAGQHVVNGRLLPLKPGDTVYIPPYSHHMLINTSDEEPLKLLGVYIPAGFQSLLTRLEGQYCNLDDRKYTLADMIEPEVVGRLLNKLAHALKLSMRLLDAEGRCLITSDNLPRLCHTGRHCQTHLAEAIGGLNPLESTHIVTCCGRVSSIIIPIIGDNIIHGYLKCGEFFLSPDDPPAMRRELLESRRAPRRLKASEADSLVEELAVEKKSRLHTATEGTIAVADYIAESGLARVRQRELELGRLSIIQGQVVTAQLEKSLREADFKLLQSQINPHFLFNTLNIISQMAYLEGAEKTAGLVLSLSGFMRATLRRSQVLVPLAEEIKLVRDYLNIQATRFGDRLRAAVTVEPGLEGVRIPILILQPLVENVIVHVVETRLAACLLEVTVRRAGNGLIGLTVADNGPGLANPEEESSGLGLTSIQARLRHFFGDRFSFSLDSRPGRGLSVHLTIPESLEYEH